MTKTIVPIVLLITAFSPICAQTPIDAATRQDVEDLMQRANLASSYAKLGQAYVVFASKSRAPLAARAERWSEARKWFEKSLNLWTTMNQSGTLPGNKATELDEVAKQIAHCDAALRKVRSSP